MHHRLPILAVALGIAGLIPFLITGLGAVAPNAMESRPAADMLLVYGAAIASFLGGVHWGLTLAVEHDPYERERLFFGVAPASGAWLAAGCGPWLGNRLLGLLAMIAVFLLTASWEWKAHHRGLLPGGYTGLRLVLTALVAMIMVTVLVIRAIGGSVMF